MNNETGLIAAYLLDANMAIGLLIIFQLVFTYLPVMHNIFATTAISIIHWVKIIVISVSVLLLVEFEKYLIRTFGNQNKT